MRQPRSLDEAKAMVRAEKAKLSTALKAIAGAPAVTAVLAALLIAFGVNLLYSPTQLPLLGDWTFASIGLPNLDLGLAGEQAAQIRDAAAAQDVSGRALSWADQNPDKVPLINAIGAGGALALLFVNLGLTARRYGRAA
ncbi:MAG TPA: hypothetical protein VEA80_12115 [Vitreimonas sp.]|uniref:hypothetical protein n=1 Tax=Vitreimonas sp. TaxID=3069702 RepID=UPI002D5C5A33|nr:hypothetical protein [Vitreimonas sp.]HYD88216.1 hypothetical protein [Vitreimonas sp.]